MNTTKKRQFPNAMVIIMGIIFLCAILSYIVPAGGYDMMTVGSGDAAKEVINPTTFHYMEKTPVTLMQLLTAIPRGMINSAPVIFLIFIVGGSFNVIQETGAIEAGVGRLAKRLAGKEMFLIPVIVFLFSLGSATAGMAEEMILFIPLMVGLAMALGFDSITGFAMVMCCGSAGFAGAITTPFTVVVAQGIAEIPLISGWQFRILVFLCMVTPLIIFIMHYAKKVKKNPELSPMYEIDKKSSHNIDFDDLPKFGIQEILVLLVFVGSLVLVVIGTTQLGWYLNELCAVYLADGILAALITRMGFNKFAQIFGKGMSDIAVGALLVGFASAVLVVLQDGNILNTILNSAAQVLSTLPSTIGAIGMYIFQCLFNFLVPSGSGQAALSMPIMAPLADMIGVSRQTAVLAFQMGDGISNIIIPTNGVTLAALGMVGISWEKWAKWIMPLIGIQYALGAVLIVIAQMIGFC